MEYYKFKKKNRSRCLEKSNIQDDERCVVLFVSCKKLTFYIKGQIYSHGFLLWQNSLVFFLFFSIGALMIHGHPILVKNSSTIVGARKKIV